MCWVGTSDVQRSVNRRPDPTRPGSGRPVFTDLADLIFTDHNMSNIFVFVLKYTLYLKYLNILLKCQVGSLPTRPDLSTDPIFAHHWLGLGSGVFHRILFVWKLIFQRNFMSFCNAVFDTQKD